MLTRRSFLASLAALGLPSSLIGSTAPSTAPAPTGYLGHVYGGDASSRVDFCRSFRYYYEKHLRAKNQKSLFLWVTVDGMAKWRWQKAQLLSMMRLAHEDVHHDAYVIVMDMRIAFVRQTSGPREWDEIFRAARDSGTIVLAVTDDNCDNGVKFAADFRVLLDGDPTMVKWRRVPEWVRDCWTGRPIGV